MREQFYASAAKTMPKIWVKDFITMKIKISLTSSFLIGLKLIIKKRKIADFKIVFKPMDIYVYSDIFNSTKE